MSLIETPLMRGLERVLDAGVFQHQVIASNLANIDTPGYRTREVRPFAGEMEQAMSGEQPMSSPVSHQISGLLERPDGNNVSADRESLLLAQNQMRFSVAVQFMKAEFKKLASAIALGGSAS